MKQGNSTIALNKVENELTETARDIQIRINHSEDSTIANLGQTFQGLMVKYGLDNGKGQPEEEQGSEHWPWLILIVIWLIQLICDLFSKKEEPVVEGEDNNNQRQLIIGHEIENSLVNLKKQIQHYDNEKPLKETKEIIAQMNKMLEMVRIITNPFIRYESSVDDDYDYLDEKPIQSPSVTLSLLNDEIEEPIPTMANDIDPTEQEEINDEVDRDLITPQSNLLNSGTLVLFDSRRYNFVSDVSDTNNNDTACLEKANDLIDSTVKLLTDIKPKLSDTLLDKVSKEIEQIKQILCGCNDKDTLKSSFNRQKKATLSVFHPDKYQNESNETQKYAEFIFKTFNTLFDQIKQLDVANDIVDAFWSDLETRCQELFQSQDELRAFFDDALREAREMERQADEVLNDFKEIKENTHQMLKETQETNKQLFEMSLKCRQTLKEWEEERKEIQADRAQIKKDIEKTKQDIVKTKQETVKTKKETEETKKETEETKKETEETKKERKDVTSRLKALKERNENKSIQENYKSRSAPVLKKRNLFLSEFASRISTLKETIETRISSTSKPNNTIYIHLLVTIKSTLSVIESNQLNERAVGLLLSEIKNILDRYKTNESNEEFYNALKGLSDNVLSLPLFKRFKSDFDNAVHAIKEKLYQKDEKTSSATTTDHVRLFTQSAPNLRTINHDQSFKKEMSI